jgi:hypothetical protein
MESTMIKTMAKFEYPFHKNLDNIAPLIIKRHRKSLDDDYHLKHANMIADLDTMSASLKTQMTKDFDNSWSEFRDNHLHGQVQASVQRIAQKSLQNIRTNSD